MKRIVLFAVFACLGAAFAKTPEGWTDDYDAALRQAAAEKKTVLADFSGSDWCKWCQKLDQEVFSTAEFRKAASARYVLLYVDLPSDPKALSEQARARNMKLAQRYAVRQFPTVLALDATGKELARTGYQKGGAAAFLKTLEEAVLGAPEREKYLKPLEDAWAAVREALQKESEPQQEAYLAKMTNTVATLSAEEKVKRGQEAMQEMQTALFGTVVPKYVPLFEKALADIRAAVVPANLEEAKQSFLQECETEHGMLKAMLVQFERQQANPSSDDEDDTDGFMFRREKRGLVIPTPEDAKTDEDYFRNVAEPFYMERLVDAYRPAADVTPETADRVRAVRRALVRALVTGRDEFPVAAEFELAHGLWRDGCRDAAVAIVHYDGLNSNERYTQSEDLFKYAVEAFDFDADPFMGFLLRLKDVFAGHARLEASRDAHREPVKEAEVACSNAFVRVAEVFRNADHRIAERLDELWGMPDGAAELIGDEYLALCRRAKICMDLAFESRGTGWASDVSDEQWDGWRDYNAQARSNLTAAVALRPEDARALMMLASLDARSCGAGDPLDLVNRAVSNSLDRAAETIGGVLHFKTTRWGGSTEFLKSVVLAATSNVCTRSTFAYRVAAETLGEIFGAECTGIPATGRVARVLTPEVTSRLYSMFDQYIAAPESPYMPRRDVFVGMAVSLALQKRDWPTVRKYAALYRNPVASWQDAWWIRWGVRGDGYAEIINLFEIIGTDRERREKFIDAEIAMVEGRYADADAVYRHLLKSGRLADCEELIANRQGFRAHRYLQEAQGGWVDIMPTESASEGSCCWSTLGTQKDGRVRNQWRRSFYCVNMPLPGKNAEYEATVHLETNNVSEATAFVGWGLACPYKNDYNSRSWWGFPFVGFWRDREGDHVQIECPTRENTARNYKVQESRYIKNEGFYANWGVYRGKLEPNEAHAFRVRWDDEGITVTVDGKKIWSVTTETLLSVSDMRDRIQPDFSVFPVWKVFKGASFDGYRYRLIKDGSASGSEAKPASDGLR